MKGKNLIACEASLGGTRSDGSTVDFEYVDYGAILNFIISYFYPLLLIEFSQLKTSIFHFLSFSIFDFLADQLYLNT